MVNLEPNREGFRAGPAGKAACGRYGIRSQHRHYPYWYEGTLSTRGPLAASEYPCANPQYRPYCRFTYAYAWDWSTAPLTCTLFCNAGKHVAWHASPPSLKKDTDMQTSLRKLAPALAVM